MLSYADRVAASSADALLLIGRTLVGGIFIMSGWSKLMDVPAFVATMPRRGLSPFLGYVAPPVEFISGVFIILGFATRYTCLVMLLFVIIATFSSHRFWTFTDPAQYTNQFSHFSKNVSMMGGILLLFITGPGRWSFDSILSNRTSARR